MTSTDSAISTYTVNGTTYYEFDGLTVAKVIKVGNYRVRCYVSPDEYHYSEWATPEAAHNVALKHAMKFA